VRLTRRTRPPIQVEAGERVLAWAEAAEGVVAGTRDALYLRVGGSSSSSAEPVVTRIAWETVEAADWDRETSVLRFSEVGTWGEARPEHRLTIEEPGRLLELVRERVTASVVLQRHVTVAGRRGLRVIARRAPSGSGRVQWVYEYDEGLDPDDPVVREVARATLQAMRSEVGLP
jgi:hypothetical protein